MEQVPSSYHFGGLWGGNILPGASRCPLVTTIQLLYIQHVQLKLYSSGSKLLLVKLLQFQFQCYNYSCFNQYMHGIHFLLEILVWYPLPVRDSYPLLLWYPLPIRDSVWVYIVYGCTLYIMGALTHLQGLAMQPARFSMPQCGSEAMHLCMHVRSYSTSMCRSYLAI